VSFSLSVCAAALYNYLAFCLIGLAIQSDSENKRVPMADIQLAAQLKKQTKNESKPFLVKWPEIDFENSDFVSAGFLEFGMYANKSYLDDEEKSRWGMKDTAARYVCIVFFVDVCCFFLRVRLVLFFLVVLVLLSLYYYACSS
jgi:hypothetical protein